MNALNDTLNELSQVNGRVGFWYAPLDGTNATAFQADEPLVAASVIKLPILVETFARFSEGTLDPDAPVTIRPETKMPSCGALTYMHDGLTVTTMDLAVLMIILSDNTATNLLIDRLGADSVNRRMRALGLEGLTLRRKLFDKAESARGIQNTVTARGVGELLLRMAGGALLGKKADNAMLEILLNQRLNGKMPFHLHSRGIRVAHKTGEDDGITHDVGVVFAQKPFAVCFLSNNVDVPAFERLIQDRTRDLAQVAC